MSEQPTANTLFKAAQALVKEGQPIFPCYASGDKAKRPMTRNGVYDATLDIGKIQKWWKRYGTQAAIGIPTGVLWDVLDVDVKRSEDGRVHLPMLHRVGLLNGCQRVVRTPSGGFHLYFKASPGLTNKANASMGLDVRSTGGYVLAAPSFISTDDYEGSYLYEDDPVGATDDPLNWDLIRSSIAPRNESNNQPIELLPYERQTSIASLREWLSKRSHGERNNSMFWAINRCIDGGIDPHELVDVAVMIGLDEEEIMKSINSALARAGVSTEELRTEAEALFGND